MRSIPFPTRRATFAEVKRVRDVLASVEVHLSDSRSSILSENLSNKSKRSLAKSKKIHRSKSRDSPKRRLPKVVEDLAAANVDTDDTDDDDVQLTWQQNVESSTQSLSEFDNTAPPPKRSNKKKSKKKVNKPTCLFEKLVIKILSFWKSCYLFTWVHPSSKADA